ncbi:hypothetical protein BJV74DRAFT_467050 [Russula compacta]|nr:hypothetical protein BJV74DRAFT_467050 [Russula compacta]
MTTLLAMIRNLNALYQPWRATARATSGIHSVYHHHGGGPRHIPRCERASMSLFLVKCVLVMLQESSISMCEQCSVSVSAHLHFTHGEIVGDMSQFTVTDFRFDETTIHRPSTGGTGHGGGGRLWPRSHVCRGCANSEVCQPCGPTYRFAI